MTANACPLPPLLLGAVQAGALAGVSARTWWSLHSGGRCPLPIRLNRRTLWRRDEIELWCKLNCPSRDRFYAMKEARP